MENLYEFLAAMASHWLLLSMAAIALLYCRFGSFDPDKKVVPLLLFFALGCILLVLYLTVTKPLTAT